MKEKIQGMHGGGGGGEGPHRAAASWCGAERSLETAGRAVDVAGSSSLGRWSRRPQLREGEHHLLVHESPCRSLRASTSGWREAGREAPWRRDGGALDQHRAEDLDAGL
jgi:hypothetical protein